MKKPIENKSMNVVNFSETDSLLSTFIREIRDTSVQNDRLRFRRNIERIGEINECPVGAGPEGNASAISQKLSLALRFISRGAPIDKCCMVALVCETK